MQNSVWALSGLFEDNPNLSQPWVCLEDGFSMFKWSLPLPSTADEMRTPPLVLHGQKIKRAHNKLRTILQNLEAFLTPYQHSSHWGSHFPIPFHSKLPACSPSHMDWWSGWEQVRTSLGTFHGLQGVRPLALCSCYQLPSLALMWLINRLFVSY